MRHTRRSPPDRTGGALGDVVDFAAKAVTEHAKHHDERFRGIMAMPDAAAKRDALLAFFLEAESAFDARMRDRFPAGGRVYGSRDVKLSARERAIADALQVRPALTLIEVFQRAGVSRSAGYRILERMNKKT